MTYLFLAPHRAYCNRDLHHLPEVLEVIQHVGNRPYRQATNPLEKIFADRWNIENNPPDFVNGGHGVLAHSLCSEGDGRITRDLTQDEATIAATVIQWLGSPCGFGWLEETLKACGYKLEAEK